MKRHHEVDEFFRKKLEHYGSQAPMHLWEGITQKMDEKKEQKPLFPFFVRTVMPSILLAGAATFIIWLHSTRYSQIDKEPVQLGSFPIQYWSPAIDATTPEKEAPQAQLLPAHQASDQAHVTTSASFQQEQEQPQLQLTLAKQDAAANQEAVTATPSPDVPEENTLPATVATSEENTLLTKSLAAAELIPSLDLFDQAGKRFFMLPQEIRCARFGGSTWHFYTELQAGLELPMREFQARNAEAVEYARKREQTESPSGAYSAMLRFSAISDKGLALRTGLQYAQINERFSYYNENEQRTIITDIYDSNGHLIRTDTVWVAGAEYTANNRYKMINLPFVVGYERDFGLLTFAINAGASLNLWMDAGGKYLSPDDLQQPVAFGSAAPAEQGNTYKNSLGLGWYGSLGIIYEMKHNWQLIAEPSFRIYPKSLTLGNQPVDHRYFIAGINLGIRRAL